MLRAGEFSELAAFVAVAQARSFRQAATRLNLRPSTLSHAVRALEERLGVKLLARTTRSVAPTAAGLALLSELAPALATLADAAEVVNRYRARPHGTVRLAMPQSAASVIVAPRLGALALAYPDVKLDIVVDDGFVDIVRHGFDAGIRIGEDIGDGMTAVRIGRELRTAVVAAPAYWADHPPPATPRDLLRHNCINRRYALDRGIYRWRFTRGEEHVEIACEGQLTLNSEPLMRQAALSGVGVANLVENDVAADVAAGRLQRVLEGWCPPMWQFCLYHASHRLPSASLRAVIDTLRAPEPPVRAP